MSLATRVSDRSLFLTAFFLAVTACGGGGGDGADAAAAGGECEGGAMATSDAYFPLIVGNVWRYNVTDLTGADPPHVKRQELTEEIVPEGETQPVIVQVTTKATGRTESWFRREGDAVIRLRQQDFDPDGLLERTTLYEPYKLRLDESPAHTAVGATWDEANTSIVSDPAGVEISRVDVVDQWTVVGVGVPCQSAWGELECLQVHVERIQGGVASKDYFFAAGYGKVREEGSQLEELIGCFLY